MNNDQFRKLVSSNTSRVDQVDVKPSETSAAPRISLGARQRTGASFTPRSLGPGFSRKGEGGDGSSNGQKKFKSSVPKGSKLATGYVDRAKERRNDEEDDETTKRIKALEEQLKGEEIDQETFERLRDDITAGDISRTHLVKGLDRRLLERVRRGENVNEERDSKAGNGPSPSEDIDDVFDELESHEVVAEAKNATIKQGEKAKPAAVAGQKRTRDQILADLKAQREQAKAAARPSLGSGFKKITKDSGPRVEIDAKGREVLITTDERGNIKRRVKKAKAAEEEDKAPPKEKQEVLGADVQVPVFERAPSEESDDDIFADAGHDFNPLADLEDDESSGDDASERKKVGDLNGQSKRSQNEEPSGGKEAGETASAALTSAPKNYFNDDPSSFSVLGNIKNDLNDPAIIAALARSRQVDTSKLSESSRTLTAEEEAKKKRREAMLSTQDRDLEDMDMGFGGSRFDDQEEAAMGDAKVKFSQWRGGEGDDDEDEHGDRGGKKRKRGPKKKKGDKNSAADVMKVMEGQRKS